MYIKSILVRGKTHSTTSARLAHTIGCILNVCPRPLHGGVFCLQDLGECKTMAKPPAGVDDVFAATMVLLAGTSPSVVTTKAGKVKDRSWDASKKQLLGEFDFRCPSSASQASAFLLGASLRSAAITEITTTATASWGLSDLAPKPVRSIAVSRLSWW